MLGKKNIVAVDDSAIMLRSLKAILSEKYDFFAFTKGERALSFLEQMTPDLIILDIEMPEINGYDLLEMIKKNKALQNVPVIFLTSNSGKDSVIKAVEGGINDYVRKPVDEDTLLNKIQKLLSKKK